jgi:peroxiredoxin
MQQVQDKYRDKGLVIVGVNLDQDHQLAEDFLKVFRPQFKVVFDQKAQLAEDFHVKGMPASFFIDRGGKVRYQHIGFRANERSDYERELETLLAEK